MGSDEIRIKVQETVSSAHLTSHDDQCFKRKTTVNRQKVRLILFGCLNLFPYHLRTQTSSQPK